MRQPDAKDKLREAFAAAKVPAEIEVYPQALDGWCVAAMPLDDLIKQRIVASDDRVDLARSTIGMAVRAGAAKPDIGTVDALRRTLLQAQSIAVSSSASGVYLSTDLFPRLGIADQIA